MNRYTEMNAQLTTVEQIEADQSTDVTEARALTISEMDVVGGGSVVAWLF